MSDPRPLGVDTGYFKGSFAKHNWSALPADVRLVLPVFGSGKWTEPDAAKYVEAIEASGRLWSPWYFPFARLSPALQVAAWMKTPVPAKMPVWVDYERSRDGKIPNASQLLEILRRVEDATGRPAGIYSRKELVDLHLATMPYEELNRRWFWLAQYIGNRTVEDTRPIILPNRVDRARVLIHQTADRIKPFPGFYTHVPEPDFMDTDRWIGKMTMAEFVGSSPPQPIPPSEPSDAEKLSVLWAWYKETNP